jgi:hypothetical protein
MPRAKKVTPDQMGEAMMKNLHKDLCKKRSLLMLERRTLNTPLEIADWFDRFDTLNANIKELESELGLPSSVRPINREMVTATKEQRRSAQTKKNPLPPVDPPASLQDQVTALQELVNSLVSKVDEFEKKLVRRSFFDYIPQRVR